MNALRSRFRRTSPPNFLTWLALPILLLIVAGYAWRPLAGGDDFWAHAAIGRWIVEHRQIPTHTLFLWSERVPWIAHAWGTGLIFYGLMSVGGAKNGPFLVQGLNIALSAAPWLLLWRFWRRDAPFSSLMPPLFVLAIWVSSARYQPRPELFTALFLTLLLLFLTRWLREKAVPHAQIGGVLLMFALWPNLHGAVAFGLLMLGVTAIFETVETRGADIRLLFLFALCTLIVFVCNPRGFEFYRALLPIGSQAFKRIDEWKPFWQWPQLGLQLVVGEVLLWSIGMLLWATNPGRKWAQLGWMLLMMAAFLKARRQLWLTAITSLVVIVSNAQQLESESLFRGWRRLTRGDANQRLPDPMRLITRAGVLIILLCAAAQAIDRKWWPPRATNRYLPVKMAAFLRDRAPKGRIFNDYEFSAYLEWALHGRRSLYIDLNNAYPDSLMEEYFQTIKGSQNARETASYDARRGRILAKRKIRVVALRPFKSTEGLSVLAKYLDKNPGWKRIYRGEDGTVWARR
ncbi:MAG TPA: hypothetical protein VF627_04165 [Abditibacterium sp.]|jgi:hypothetical protein